MTEEDTFKALQRQPFEVIHRLFQNTPTVTNEEELEIWLKQHHWDYDEFYEHYNHLWYSYRGKGKL